jgi:hypothetical protein
MVDKPTVSAPDPLKDSDEEERVKIAEMRTHRDGDGTWPTGTSSGRGDANGYEDTGTSYSNYLFGGSGQSDKPLWSDTTKGRAAIRLVSRGIFGAGAFALGQRYARREMIDYEPFEWNRSKPLHWIAKGFDETFGRGIKFVARTAAPAHLKDEWAYEVTRFRHKGYFHDQPGKAVGRSFGAEVVGVTFDFAMASVGDATARNVIQAFDPNNIKPWFVDDKGKPSKDGHFDFGKWAKAVGVATWRVISKNQGEDWVAAIPYVYQMKWQRQWIANNKAGFKVSADNGWFGSSYVVNDEGKVIGDYNTAGALDLHARFVGYNWYTLMFREAYDSIAMRLMHATPKDTQAQPGFLSNPVAAIVNDVGLGARYVLKSFIKANIYMNPAVVPFWIMRVPQNKWKAGVLHFDPNNPGMNAIGAHSDAGSPTTRWNEATQEFRFHSNAAKGALIAGESWLNHPRSDRKQDTLYYSDGQNVRGISNPFKNHNPYDYSNPNFAYEKQPGVVRKSMNFLGSMSFKAGSKMTQLSDHAPTWLQNFLADKHNESKYGHYNPVAEREQLMRTFVDASFSYTPYMWAKAETALRVDERPNNAELGDMDKAINHFIDNVFSFKIGAAVSSIGDIAYRSVHSNVHVKSREGNKDQETGTAIKPAPKVQAKSIERASTLHDPVHLERTEGDEHEDKRWAESVAGRKLGGQFLHSTGALH